MPRVIRSAITLVLLALVAGLLAAAPAQAATRSVDDPRGDAPRAVDIVGATIDNSDTRMSGKVRIRDLGQLGRIVVGWSDGEDGFGVTIEKRRRGKAKATFSRTRNGNSRAVKCAGASVGWNLKGNRVSFDVPQSCFGSELPGSWDVVVAAFRDGSMGFDTTRQFSVPRG